VNALPASPSAVCAFLAAQAGLCKRASTLGRRLAAIGYFHKLAGEPSPIGNETIKATLTGSEEGRDVGHRARHGGR
jgi:hypothetical protein